MPLSLPLLAATAPNHEYTFVDMLAGEKPNLKAPADLVGISARITAEKLALEIADRYRARGVKVVLGGAQISSNPHLAIEHADAVVIGEGEGVWPVLLRDAAANTLKDFYLGAPLPFDEGGRSVHRSDAYLPLTNLGDAIATRKLYRKRYVFDTVYAARGCPLNCDFCSVGHLFGKKVRIRPVADVVREIDTFKGFYYLMDDTVFGRPSTYEYYNELYDTIASRDKVRLWYGQANLDAASSSEGREVIRKAAASGLLIAAIGMESINPAVMRKAGTISKNGTKDPERVLDQMRESIRFIQDQGIVVSGWFTIGYEEDTVDTFYETLDFCLENHIVPVLCPLEALPGTELYSRLMAEGRVDFNKRINVVHPTMTDDDILGAMDRCTKKGFSLGTIYARTRFYAEKMRPHPFKHNRSPGDRIRKSVFVFIWQTKIKQGIVGLANMGSAG